MDTLPLWIILIYLNAVDKYVSPEERARRAAEEAAHEEARRRAEADDAKQRALKDMMNSNPAVRKDDKAKKRLVSELRGMGMGMCPAVAS